MPSLLSGRVLACGGFLIWIYLHRKMGPVPALRQSCQDFVLDCDSLAREKHGDGYVTEDASLRGINIQP